MDDALAIELAQRQHGVVAGYQLLALGYDARTVHRIRRHSGWEPLDAVIIRRTGTSRGVDQRVCAAVLEAGEHAFLSHESAAAWWGHKGCRLESPLHVTTQSWSGRRPTLSRCHQVRRVDLRWVTDHNDVRTARPELVALHLFATMARPRAERIVEWMWAHRLLSGRTIGLFLRDLGRRGRNGTAGLRDYYDTRGDGYIPSESGLESRAIEILRNSGISVRRQVDVGDDDTWTGRVDLLHAYLPLVIEVQSALYHSSLVDAGADGVRMEKLKAAGFVVVEVNDSDVWNDPGAVVRLTREGMEKAAALSRSV